MNKKELIEKIYNQLENAGDLPESWKKEEVEAVTNYFFDLIGQSLQVGEMVEIRGFGKFVKKRYKGYVGRNPQTGEQVVVGEKFMPVFRMSQKIVKRVKKPTKKRAN